MRVIYANATYTGGGIYQYTGQFDNGNYFQTWTDYEDYIQELDVNPEENWDDNSDEQWQNEHMVAEHYGSEATEILMAAMLYIIAIIPVGNYSLGEIQDALDSIKQETEIDGELEGELEGKKVRIVFEDGTTADITGEIVLAEDNRIHICVEN